MATMFEWINHNRPDVTYLKGPLSDGSYIWDASLSNQEEILNLISTFDSNWNMPNPSKAKILRYVYEQHKNTDVRTIDHNTMLSVSLKMIEVLGAENNNRGLLIEKQYFYENEIIFKIMYTYEKNECGQYTGQRLVLEWFAEDGTIAFTKDKGMEPLSANRSKEIVKSRRKSVANMLENNVEALLLASGSGNAGLALGRAMLADIAPHTQTFIESGVSTGIVNYVSDPAKHAIYPFLLAEVAPGVSVVMYIIDFLDFT